MPAEKTTKDKKEITRKFLVRAVLAGFVIGLGGTAFLICNRTTACYKS